MIRRPRPASAAARLDATRGAVLATLAALTLGGLALRLRSLGAQSLWFDEAMSVVFASQPAAELMALLAAEDIHPPLYTLLLHFWIGIAGNGEFAVRFLSVVPGVVITPLMYVTGKRLDLMSGEQPARVSPTGMAAAVLSASSAFYIGYSREARSYMVIAFLGLLCSYLLLRALRSEGRLPWAIYAASAAAAIYTHYTAFLLLVFHLVFVAVAGRGHRGVMRRWLLSIGASGLTFLPWAGVSVSQMMRVNDFWPGTLQLGTVLRSSLMQFLAGSGAGAKLLIIPAGIGLAVLLLGLVALIAGLRAGPSSHSSLFLLAYLALPSLALFGMAYFRPKFDPRYLAVVTPAFYLTLARGTSLIAEISRSRALPRLARPLPPLAGVAILLGVVAVSFVYGEPSKAKADYRSLVSYLDARTQPGDAVVFLMNAPHPYLYYSSRPVAWYPMERVDDFGGAIIRLNRLAESHRRLWFVLWQQEWEDPGDYVMHIMEDQTEEVRLDRRFQGVELRLFELNPGRPFNYYQEIQHPIEAVFGSILEFWGWNWEGVQPVKETYSAGDHVKVDVHWRTNGAPNKDLKGNLALVDKQRHEWLRVDKVLGTSLYSPTRWKESEIIHDRYGLDLPGSLPPGEYELELRVYDPATLKESEITRASGASLGTVLTLGSFKIARPSSNVPSNAAALASWQARQGQVDLVKAALARPVAAPGDRVEATLSWRAHAAGQDYSVRLDLADETGRRVASQTLPLIPGYATSKWRDGELLESKYWLAVPVNLDGGRLWVTATLLAGPDKSPTSYGGAQVAHLDVLAPRIVTELPRMQQRSGARFAGKAELAGYDLSATTARPGGTLRLTLYWKALDTLDKSYKVFNHVINDANSFAGQADSVPAAGGRPTTTWRRGEVVADTYTIPISEQAGPGRYALKTGLYAEVGGERLPVSLPGAGGAGDSVTLATIEVTP